MEGTYFEHSLHMDDMNDTMDMNMTSMVMTFQFTQSGTVLFDRWSFSTVGGLIGSMVAVFVLALGYEAIKFLRAYLLANSINIRKRNQNSGDERFAQLTILSKSHLIQTCFHGIQAILGYFLMLIVMTYNAWLGIAVVIGLVCGYFIFGWKMSVMDDINSDHCA